MGPCRRSGALARSSKMLALVAFALLSSFIASLLVVIYPLVTLALLGAVVVAMVTVRLPEYTLAFGTVLTLAGGNFNSVSVTGLGVLAMGAAVASFGLIRARRHHMSTYALLIIGILTWLVFRFALGDDPEISLVALRCVAAVVLAAFCIDRARDWATAFALAGIVFVMVSVFFGEFNEAGTRFAGISGNPNRMVFGLLMLLPFMLNLTRHRRGLLPRAVTALAVVAAVVILIQSGSAQGLVGLGVLAVAIVGWIVAGRSKVVQIVFWLGAGIIGTVLAFRVLPELRFSDDVETLSGRIRLYESAINEILAHPWVGTGLRHVSEGLATDRSPHSALLGLAASGGVVLGLAWAVLLIALVWRGTGLLRRRSLLGAVPLLIVTEQFVQSVELLPATWAIVSLFLLDFQKAKNDNH